MVTMLDLTVICDSANNEASSTERLARYGKGNRLASDGSFEDSFQTALDASNDADKASRLALAMLLSGQVTEDDGPSMLVPIGNGRYWDDNGNVWILGTMGDLTMERN